MQQFAEVSGNRILAGLPADVSERLASSLRHLSLNQHDVIYRCGDPIRYVYFPLEPAVVTVLASTADGRSVEVNMTGSEAALGVQAVLGAATFSNMAVVHFPGAAFKIETEVLREEFERGCEIHSRILAYIRYLLLEASQTAACNRVHHLKQRLCRWLLGVQDRVRKDEFPATHEILSQALGTPRSEITIAAGALRQAGIIDYKRGSIVIKDRNRLEATVCECYHAVQRSEALCQNGILIPRKPVVAPAVLRFPIAVSVRAQRTVSRRS